MAATSSASSTCTISLVWTAAMAMRSSSAGCARRRCPACVPRYVKSNAWRDPRLARSLVSFASERGTLAFLWDLLHTRPRLWRSRLAGLSRRPCRRRPATAARHRWRWWPRWSRRPGSHCLGPCSVGAPVRSARPLELHEPVRAAEVRAHAGAPADAAEPARTGARLCRRTFHNVARAQSRGAGSGRYLAAGPRPRAATLCRVPPCQLRPARPADRAGARPVRPDRVQRDPVLRGQPLRPRGRC